MRISDWSSDVCSSDLPTSPQPRSGARTVGDPRVVPGFPWLKPPSLAKALAGDRNDLRLFLRKSGIERRRRTTKGKALLRIAAAPDGPADRFPDRSVENTAELQALMLT